MVFDDETESSLFEQTIEGVARIGGWFVQRSCRSRFVRCKEVAEVCLLAIGDPLGLRFAAAVAHRRIVVHTVQATVNVCRAVRAFVGARDGTF